jgi:putative solute:sodium symporter small subunit
MPDRNARSHWTATKQLMLLMLALWLLFAVVVPLFVVPINRLTIPYLDLPLGFVMAAQCALIAFVIVAFVFARGRSRVDRDRFVDRS